MTFRRHPWRWQSVPSKSVPGRSSRYRSGERTVADLAELFSVSRATAYRVLERAGNSDR
ncbi:helix-turn-helix domain-containing protein [Streptomyces sp. NPDC006510]|uniref:helix-turn-helix domain-containing protein n=1 Tax=Streptomyces sp. NPDC006510 TaxID=3155600 RepID=UPI0033A9FF8E